MRELRTIHPMDVRGYSTLRRGSQTCQSHAVAEVGVVMVTAPFLFSCSLPFR